MNSLSWMIYAAEALGNLSFVFGMLGLISIFAGMVVAGFGTLFTEKSDIAKSVWRRWWIPTVLLLLSAVLPSQKTIYLIAASEAGETIITNPEAKEVFDDLKTIIKSKLKEQLPKVEG